MGNLIFILGASAGGWFAWKGMTEAGDRHRVLIVIGAALLIGFGSYFTYEKSERDMRRCMADGTSKRVCERILDREGPTYRGQ